MHALHPFDPRWVLTALAALVIALVTFAVAVHLSSGVSVTSASVPITDHAGAARGDAAVSHALTHPLSPLKVTIRSPLAAPRPR